MLLNLSAENEHVNYSKMSKNWNKLNRPLHTLPEHCSYICIHRLSFLCKNAALCPLVLACLEEVHGNKEGNVGVLLGHFLSFGGLLSLCLPHSEVLTPQLPEHFSFTPHTRCTWITGWKRDGNAGRAHSFSVERVWVLGVCVYPHACSYCWAHFSLCWCVFLYACHSI